MANSNRRFTVTLDIDVKDAKSQIQKSANEIKRILENMSSATDKMKVFKELVDYVQQLDDALERLRQTNSSAFNHMFDGLDAGLRGALESVFGMTKESVSQLDAIKDRINAIKNSGKQTGHNTEMQAIAKDINELYKLMGKPEPIDIDKMFKGKGNFDDRINLLTNSLDGFGVVWDGVNDKIKQGFGIGGAEAGENVTNKFQKEIDKMNEQIDRLKNLMQEFDKVNSMVQQYKNAEDISLDMDINEESIKQLLNTIKELDPIRQKFQSGKIATPEDYNDLIKYTEALTKYFFIRDQLMTDSKSKTLANDYFDIFTKESFVPIENFFDSINDNFFGSFKKKMSNTINSIQTSVDKLKVSGLEDADENNGVKVNKELIMSYDELINKVKEYKTLVEQLDDDSLDDNAQDAIYDRMEEIQSYIKSFASNRDEIQEIGTILNNFNGGEIDESNALLQLANALGIEIPQSAQKATESVDELFQKLNQLKQKSDATSDIDELNKIVSERQEALSVAAKNNTLSEEQLATEKAITDEITNRINKLKSQTTGEYGDGKGFGYGTGMGSGSSNEPAYTSAIESAITAAAESIKANDDSNASKIVSSIDGISSELSSKLAGPLKVSMDDFDGGAIQTGINNIKSLIDKISNAITKYNTLKDQDEEKAQVEAMKSTLMEFFKQAQAKNEQKDLLGHYQGQELSGYLMSSGNMVVNHGEKGSVPWERSVESLMSDLRSTLIADIHTHPLHDMISGIFRNVDIGKHTYVSDSFSGSTGDLAAFRQSKRIGAQMAAMFTGDVLQTIDLRKITEDQMRNMRDALGKLEKEYMQQYPNYFFERDGKQGYIQQKSIDQQHEIGRLFEEMMLKAFAQAGVSDDLFQKYDIKNDQDMDALAARLVNLANGAQNAVDPVENLSRIINEFNGDTISTKAQTVLDSFKKGEMNAANAFNTLTHGEYTTSQGVIDNLLKINATDQMSTTEQLLSTISGTLESINSSLSSISTSIQKDDGQQLDSFAKYISSLMNDNFDAAHTSKIKSIYDPNNITEYQYKETVDIVGKAESVFQQKYNDFAQEFNDFGIADIKKVKDLMMSYETMISNSFDAMKQVEQYENLYKTNAEMITDYGEIISYHDILEQNASTYFQSGLLEDLMQYVSAAKQQFYSSLPNDQNTVQTVANIDAGSITLDTSNIEAYLGRIESSLSTAVNALTQTYNEPKDFPDFEQLASTLNNVSASLTNVVNGVTNIPKTKQSDTSVATARIADKDTYKQISSIALGALGDRAIDGQISKMVALENGIVKVEGALQTASGLWEGFTVNVNEAGQASDLMVNKQSVLAKSLNKAAQEEKEAFQNKKDAQLIDFDKYVAGIKSYEQLSDSLKNNLKQLRSELEATGDMRDLKAWDNLFGDTKNKVSAEQNSLKVKAQVEQVKNEMDAYKNALKKSFDDLDLDVTSKNLTSEQQKIADGYQKLIAQLTAAKSSAGSLSEQQIQNLRQEASQLIQNIDLYKQQNNIQTKGKGNQHYGETALINATAKRNTLLSAAGSDVFAGSSVVAKAVQDYEAAYQRVVKLQQEIASIGKNDANLTDKKVEFKEAQMACNDYAKSLEKLVTETNRLETEGRNKKLLGQDANVNSEIGRKEELRKYVEEMYGAKAAIQDFNADYSKLTFTVQNGDGTFTTMVAQINAAKNAIASLPEGTQRAQGKFASFFSDLKTKFRSISQYLISMTGFQEVWQQVRNGVNYVREIDTALTELKKTSSATTAEYDAFIDSSAKIASKVGSTITDLISSAADYSRLGYSLSDSQLLAQNTALLMNVSEFNNVEEATSAVISSLQAFNGTAQDSIHIIDELNNVGNNYAISTDELAAGLARSSAALSVSGDSLEEQLSLLTVGNEITQDADQVANALKTVSARLRGTKSEFDDDAEGMITNVSKLQEKVKALTADANGGEGIDIVDVDGSYKSMYQVMNEIGKIWKKMDGMSQASLLELIAGEQFLPGHMVT